MDSKLNCIEKNRVWASQSIELSRGLEAVSCLSANIGAIKNNIRLGSDEADKIQLNIALKITPKGEIKNRMQSDLRYAKRISEGDDLDPMEVDLMYSLVGGVLSTKIALKEVGEDFDLSTDQLNWIKNDMLSRSDLNVSERRMSRANALYLRIEDLINMLS